jgi:V8-like Glu-specific endopeptidase
MSVNKEYRSDAPLSGDEVLELADLPDKGEPPAELTAVRNLVVLDRVHVGASRKRSLTFSAIDDYKVAQTVDDDAVVFGHVGGDITAVEVPDVKEVVEAEFDAFIPEWSGVSYSPRSAFIKEPTLLKRRNGATVHPEIPFPPENRQAYYPSAYPWRIVGRIFVWTNASAPNWAWWGTASLVGRNVIMTASHVVPWGSGSNWKALFVPGYYDGQSVYGASAASWVTSARGYRNHGQGDDMAVMRLAQPLGDWLGYFGYKTYNDNWEGGSYWTLPGYPSDLTGGQRPFAHYWFPITDDDNDGAGVELEYRADTNTGNSGSPVFGWWSGSPYVIGTHSGSEDNWFEPKQNVAAGGGALSSLIGWARNNW